MATKCAGCKTVKGKRGCQRYNKELICPKCCVAVRDKTCEGCRYYQEVGIYEDTKIGQTVESQFDEAMELLEDGSPKAVQRIRYLFRKYPNNHQVLFAMGAMHDYKKQYDDAIEYFHKAIEINPYYSLAHFNLASVYMKIADVENVMIALRNVIKINSHEDGLVTEAKRMLSRLKRLKKMVPETESLNTYSEAMSEFNEGLALMDDLEWEKAIGRFERSIELNMTHAQPYGNMGICYARLGEKEKALYCLDKAIEIHPSYEPAILHRQAVEQMKEGENLEIEMESINYGRDYPKKRSLIKELFNKLLSRNKN